MNAFERWLVKRVVAKAVVQGDHVRNVEQLFTIIDDAVENEFTEDNRPTIEAFLRERLEAVMGRKT